MRFIFLHNYYTQIQILTKMTKRTLRKRTLRKHTLRKRTRRNKARHGGWARVSYPGDDERARWMV